VRNCGCSRDVANRCGRRGPVEPGTRKNAGQQTGQYERWGDTTRLQSRPLDKEAAAGANKNSKTEGWIRRSIEVQSRYRDISPSYGGATCGRGTLVRELRPCHKRGKQVRMTVALRHFSPSCRGATCGRGTLVREPRPCHERGEQVRMIVASRRGDCHGTLRTGSEDKKATCGQEH
jgi:hypothetical protein